MRTWQQAWDQALYGEGGFYRRAEGPAGHFATSAHGPEGGLLAGALLRLAEREGLTRVVDVGCGRGELLTALVAAIDEGARPVELVGVDVVDRPHHLDERIGWITSPGGGRVPDLGRPRDALVLAHEWLDVVPCTVAEADADGTLRTVLVDEAGAERPGRTLPSADLAWSRDWWPGPYAEGDRVEVGRARDAAFAALVGEVGSGLVVAVDYGHRADARPVGGTLIGYSGGSVGTPVPDGSCDITAHVAMDSLGADGVRTQSEVLRDLGVVGTLPPRELAERDPAGYLAALSGASHATALTGPGAGDFLWAFRRV